jgi:hypothetical protein
LQKENDSEQRWWSVNLVILPTKKVGITMASIVIYFASSNTVSWIFTDNITFIKLIYIYTMLLCTHSMYIIFCYYTSPNFWVILAHHSRYDMNKFMIQNR